MNERKTLTTEQINFIHDALSGAMKKDWIDARYELVDHLSSSIEATWIKQPDLPFKDAYNQAMNKLNGGQDIEKLINAKKRAIHWSHFSSFIGFLANFKSLPLIISMIIISAVVGKQLLTSNDGLISSLNIWWAIMAVWYIFMFIDWYRFKVHSKMIFHTLRFKCYNDLMSVDLILVLPFGYLLRKYHTPNSLEIGLTYISVFVLITFLLYHYGYFRSKMLDELKTLRSIESKRIVEHA